jgi:hypothetical protein
MRDWLKEELEGTQLDMPSPMKPSKNSREAVITKVSPVDDIQRAEHNNVPGLPG